MKPSKPLPGLETSLSIWVSGIVARLIEYKQLVHEISQNLRHDKEPSNSNFGRDIFRLMGILYNLASKWASLNTINTLRLIYIIALATQQFYH
jgi:hypothetical protein